MVDHLRGELRAGGELADLAGVLRVVLLLCEGRRSDEEKRKGQVSHQASVVGSWQLAVGGWQCSLPRPTANRQLPTQISIPFLRISAISLTTVAESLPNGSATLKRISIEQSLKK